MPSFYLKFRFSRNWLNRPQSGSVTALSDTELLVQWSPVLGATDYEVRLNGGTPITVTDDLRYTFTGLTPDTAYDVEVRVSGGPWSGPVTQSTEPKPIIDLPQPTGLDLVSSTDVGITFEWDAVQDAESYEIKLEGGTPSDTGGQTQGTITGLTADTRYKLRARATSTKTNINDSPWSDILIAFTQPEPKERQVFANVIGSYVITISKNGKVVDRIAGQPTAVELVTKDMDMDSPETMKYIDVLQAEFRRESNINGLRIQIGYRNDLSDPVEWEPAFDIDSVTDINFTRFTSRFVKLRVQAESLSSFWRLSNIEIFGTLHGRRF